jgi:hypothetical protein
MKIPRLVLPLACLFATAAAAQQRSIFDPDDLVDPGQHAGQVFTSRLALGIARDLIDDYRPTGGDAKFLHLTNSVYWRNWQFDYKRSEIRPENEPPPVFRCGSCKPPVYFPTPPPPDAVPAPPPLSSRNTLQAGWYHQTGGSAGPPVTLRYRLTLTRQDIHTTIRSAATDQIIEHRSGHEQSIGLDADMHFIIDGHDVSGSLFYARTSRSGTVDDRSQQELAYTARPPGWAVARILVRPTLTVAGVSSRGATGLNVVNPALELFWHSHATKANVHLVYSPQAMRDGEHDWRTRHQIALFVDRVLWMQLFR